MVVAKSPVRRGLGTKVAMNAKDATDAAEPAPSSARAATTVGAPSPRARESTGAQK